MRYLKQSTSVDVGIGPFLDETDGKTAETALTITQPDVRLKKNGGAWAQKAATQTLSHEEAGWYEVTLDATDTDTIGILLVAVHESGALPVWMEFHVLAANVYDSLFGSGDVLDVSVTQFAGSAITAAAGIPEVKVASIAANAITAAAVAADQDSAAAAAVRTELATELGRIDAAVSTRLATAGYAAPLDAAGTRSAVGLAAANLDTQIGDLPTNAELAASQASADDATLAAIAALPTPLDAAGVRTAVGLASANLDTQLAALAAYIDTEIAAILAAVDTEVAAIKAKTDNLPAAPAATGDIPTAAANADALLDRAAGIETGVTPRQALRGILAAALGKLSGAATTTVVIRDANDTKDRITATVDADGNRTAVTKDLT